MEVDSLYSVLLGGEGKPQRKGTRHFHLLYEGGTQVGRELSLDDLLNKFDQIVLDRVLLSTGLFPVVGGAVAFGDRLVIVQSTPGQGQSTLVEALVEAGGHLYSDRYLLLDMQSAVHPFPLPIKIGDRERIFTPPRDMSHRRVGLVLFADYQESQSWRPRPVQPGQAVLKLFSRSLGWIGPAQMLEILSTAIHKAGCFQSKHSDVQSVVRFVKNKLI